MKSLRRSLNNNGSTSTSPYSSPAPAPSNPLARPSEKVAPPQKVIKALKSHRSTNPQELSYTKGDFWYVTGEREGWYEALSESRRCGVWENCLTGIDPMRGSRGLVPKSDFEEFAKGGRNVSSGTRPGSQEPSRWVKRRVGWRTDGLDLIHRRFHPNRDRHRREGQAQCLHR